MIETVGFKASNKWSLAALLWAVWSFLLGGLSLCLRHNQVNV